MDARNKIKKILVRAPNWIGDAVMALPAVESLKALYKGAEITVLTKGRAVPVFQNNPSVGGIIEYDDKGSHKGLKGRLKLRGEIKERAFDIAVLFQNAFDAAFIAFISGVPVRAGYARDFRTKLLTRPIPVTEEIKKAHQVFYYLNIVKALGGGVPKRPVPKIYLSEDERAWAESFIKDNGLKGAFLVGAAPGASYGPAKRWPPERFAEALTKIIKDRDAVALVFGASEDKEASLEVTRNLKIKYIDLTGKISLRSFMAIASRLELFITNDSGPMHIGAALGTPTIAIFGSTDPLLTGPLGPHARVVQKKTECSPCFERECRFGHYNCLSISAAEAARAADGLLKEI
ncbi:MAG: lipopolysaccharide heptosyltransferase II [Deltaproteobacteria bacterium]|nr:lipopolysaccharide heptosyltransferase II [Deltaproteobacteria bacterium]